MKSPFEALIDDLAALRDRRQIEANARAARQAQEAQRNRRLVRATVARPMAKAAPLPDYAPDWSGLQARQQQIAADLERSRIDAQKDAIRAHLATLRAAAKAGRLSAHDAALLDVYRGQALSLGLEP